MKKKRIYRPIPIRRKGTDKVTKDEQKHKYKGIRLASTKDSKGTNNKTLNIVKP